MENPNEFTGIVRINRHTGERETVRQLPSKMPIEQKTRFAKEGMCDELHGWYRIQRIEESFPSARNQ